MTNCLSDLEKIKKIYCNVHKKTNNIYECYKFSLYVLKLIFILMIKNLGV